MVIVTGGISNDCLDILNRYMPSVFPNVNIQDFNKREIRVKVSFLKGKAVKLFVLSEEFSNICKDVLPEGIPLIECSDAEDLVNCLNELYGLGIATTASTETNQPEISTKSSEDVETAPVGDIEQRYKSIIKDKDDMIACLEARVKELSLEDEDDSEEARLNMGSLRLVSEEDDSSQNRLQDLVEENSSLSSSISDLQRQLEGLTSDKREIDGKLANSEARVVELESERVNLLSTIDTVKSEVGDLQARCSELQSSVELKDTEIMNLTTSLSSSIEEVEKLREESTSASTSVEEVLLKLKETDSKYSELLVEVKQREEEIEGITKENTSLHDRLCVTDEEIKSLKDTLLKKEEEMSSLQKSYEASKKDSSLLETLNQEVCKLNGVIDEKSKTISSLEECLSARLDELSCTNKDLGIEKSNRVKLESKITKLEELVTELEGNRFVSEELESVKSKLQESDKVVVELNQELLDLKGKLDVYEGSSSTSSEINILSDKLVSLQKDYDKLNSSIFSKIGSSINKLDLLNINLLRNFSGSFSNLEFVFSGSTFSRKGTYKCVLKDILTKHPKERVLFVDLVSESAIDYVFYIDSIVSGKEWLNNGGEISNYLSKSKYDNVDVLSLGLDYISDLALLQVDWVDRLDYLNTLGCKVYLYLGDLSSDLVKILYNSFKGVGSCNVYTRGGVLDIRSTYLNLLQLSLEGVNVCVYEYNPSAKMFYSYLSKRCNCYILKEVLNNEKS